MTSTFKLILLTDDDPVDSWVAYQLSQRVPIAQTILINNDSAPRPRSLSQKLRTDPLRLLSAIPRELIRRRVEQQRDQTITEQLWDGEQLSLADALPNVWSVSAVQINSQAVAGQIRAISPDLILVCGGPILETSIFSIPRLGSWNLQWGISDRYRGQHGLFFPLALGDFDAIGATLHRIDSEINTGEVLLQFWPELEPGDTESSLEVKIARAIVPQLTSLLQSISVESSGPWRGRTIDDQQGRTVRYRDRTAWLEIQYWLKCQRGWSPLPTKPEAVVISSGLPGTPDFNAGAEMAVPKHESQVLPQP